MQRNPKSVIWLLSTARSKSPKGESKSVLKRTEFNGFTISFSAFFIASNYRKFEVITIYLDENFVTSQTPMIMRIDPMKVIGVRGSFKKITPENVEQIVVSVPYIDNVITESFPAA